MSRIVNLFFIIIVCKHIYTYKYIFMNKKKYIILTTTRLFHTETKKEREQAKYVRKKITSCIYFHSFIYSFV